MSAALTDAAGATPNGVRAPVWYPRPPADYKPRPGRRRFIVRADELARIVTDAVALALERAGLTDAVREPGAGRENGRTGSPALLSPRDVGARISRSADWVREHRGEFEQVRLSDGAKPRLLFTAASVDAWLERQTVRPAAAGEAQVEPPARRRRARRAAGDVELLQIRG